MRNGECWWDEIGETGEPRENSKNPEIAHHNIVPLDFSRIWRINKRDRKKELLANVCILDEKVLLY